MASVKITIGPLSSKTTVQLHKAIYHGVKPLTFSPCTSVFTARYGASSMPSSQRHFSTTKRTQLKEKRWFPPVETEKVKFAAPAWQHPVYTEDQMQQIQIDHRAAKTWQDKLAFGLMSLARWGMDLATGYAERPKPGPDGKVKEPWLKMTERKWLIRVVFLESVAGVPGMVGGMLRHLHSLRRMKRDNGWIETLLEEAYNERMHLLTFLKIAEPGWFMKVMILGAQGVFFNGMFLSYLASPATCHRFVAYLEEEAVYTYSRIIKEIEDGNLPQWNDSNFQIPDIAVNYWKIPEGRRTMRDLMMYVRADEAKHREVNHTLANLDQKNDPNPFVSTYADDSKPHPTKGVAQRATGWERNEVI